MIDCLIQYLNKGLVKSDFINLEMKKALRATNPDFMEWCGVINSDEESNRFLVLHEKNHMNQMYVDFITEYPDYAPRAKMTISRQEFHRWVVRYSLYKYGVEPETGRDSVGKWVRMRPKHELEVQTSFTI